jgi:hypothetical protein
MSSSTHCGDHVVIEQGLRDESEPGAEFNSGFAGRLLRTNVAVGALIDDEEAGAAHLADVEAVSGCLGRASPTTTSHSWRRADIRTDREDPGNCGRRQPVRVLSVDTAKDRIRP